MLQEISYNPIADMQEVEPFGFIDLVTANATSSVSPVNGASEPHYNGIEDPRSIGTRPSDIFEEMQANKAIFGYQAPKKTEE